MKIVYASRPARVFMEAALLAEAIVMAVTLKPAWVELLLAVHCGMPDSWMLFGDRGGNRYRALARRGITCDFSTCLLTDLGFVVRKVLRARALLASLSHELRDGLLMRYAMRTCPSWLLSLASEFTPYIRDDGLLNEQGRRVGAAAVLLDPLCTRRAHERALKELP